MTVRRYISLAKGIYNLFHEHESVIIVSEKEDSKPIEIVLSSLIRILLDPLYRTIEGMILLLKNEWKKIKER
jgi:hypothetical protein